MEKLIKEEISRITELMKLRSLNESIYNECERFSEDPKKLGMCKKIAGLKSWIHKDDGLGLKRIINNKLKSLVTDIPEELKQQFIKGADLLLSNGKISQRERDYFVNNKVNGGKLIYINGEWQPINKLNTNYLDLSEMLTDMIFRGGDNAKPIIEKILTNPKVGLLEIKPYLSRLIDKYFDDVETLNDYTKNIQRSSKIGETAEDKVKEELESKGFTTEYSGGNGDLIDMSFGTDLIMSSPEYGFKTIQVKNTERAWNKSDSYSYVDWVIIANPFTIYNNKTKEKIEI
jgi:hypothetical protein